MTQRIKKITTPAVDIRLTLKKNDPKEKTYVEVDTISDIPVHVFSMTNVQGDRYDVIMQVRNNAELPRDYPVEELVTMIDAQLWSLRDDLHDALLKNVAEASKDETNQLVEPHWIYHYPTSHHNRFTAHHLPKQEGKEPLKSHRDLITAILSLSVEFERPKHRLHGYFSTSRPLGWYVADDYISFSIPSETDIGGIVSFKRPEDNSGRSKFKCRLDDRDGCLTLNLQQLISQHVVGMGSHAIHYPDLAFSSSFWKEIVETLNKGIDLYNGIEGLPEKLKVGALSAIDPDTLDGVTITSQHRILSYDDARRQMGTGA